jgi:hypothetical protein
VVPVNPDLLLSESLGTKIGDFIVGLYKKNDSQTPDPNDIDRVRGDAATFLSTSFGADLLSTWALLKNQPTAEEFGQEIQRFFVLLVKALHEWYNRQIIENMLLILYRRNETDATFTQLVAQSRDTPGAGIYKDLLLDRTPLTNPYEWLDNAIEPKVRSAMSDAVRAAEQNIDVLVKEFNNMLSDRDGPIRFHQTDATTHDVVMDITKSTKNDQEAAVKAHRAGIKSTLNSIGVDATNASLSLRDFSATPFTMRRAFPAFRMYFIEEDNQGIIKRFDDFYNYNAITDIQIIKYKHRPATMIVTMTNLFGHLDAKTFSDMADREELADAIRENAAAGTLATQTTEEGGAEFQIDADGTKSPLREIMLKPGTKIVMKLGYDNDPDKLPTTFAGQITEVSGGAVITIVCQDWMSELLAGTSDDSNFDTSGGVWDFAKTIWNWDSTRDLQGTSSVRATIASVMQERNTLHFGHWQLDKKKRDPNYFGYRRGSSFMVRPFDNVFGDLLKFFGDDQIEGRSRALINIHPIPQPFYSAFGVDIGAVFPTEEDIKSMTLWELIEMQRRIMPNHIAMVRPYGQGDATLYFGPPWGVYVADEFDGEIDKELTRDILSQNELEVFRDMIHNNATITVSGLGRMKETWKQRLVRDFGARFGIAKNDTLEVPIGIVLEIFKDIIAENADTNLGTALKTASLSLIAIPGVGVATLAAGLLAGQAVSNQEQKTDFDVMPRLHSGSSDAIIDKWYELLIETMRAGGIPDDEDAHSVLINILSKIRKIQQATAWIRSRDEEGFDPSGSVRKSLKPIRQWHIATAKHHIIANDIQLNNNYANEVRAGDTTVRYDTEITDRRTRFASNEVPKGVDSDPDKSIYLTSILAEEMRNMYRGQLVLTGNSEIEPHDIIMIFDPTRHMQGAVEVAKVNHIFNQEMGFITIVEPHLIVEQGDYSLSTALSAFFSTLGNDIKDNNETPAGRAVNAVAGGGLKSAAAASLLVTGTTTTGLAINYIITQMLVPSHARNHPLTIYPLVKRMVPWVSGIEGASGAGVIGVMGGKVVKHLKNVRKVIEAVSDRFGDLKESASAIPQTLDTTGGSGTSSDTPTLGNYSK